MQNKNYYSILVIFIFIILGFFIVSQNSSKHNLSDIKEVKIAGSSIKIELALTSAQLEQGLSGRQKLDENTGMLFVFSQPGKYSFWMKDMNFSIDMIWINENMKVVYIKENALPSSFPETYKSGEPAKYILEVVSGFAEKNNLKIGDLIKFIYK